MYPSKTFSESDVLKSLAKADEIDRRLRAKGMSTIFEHANRRYGLLGEDAFEAWLNMRGYTYEKSLREDGKYDFIVFGLTIDVKTYPTYKDMERRYRAVVCEKQLKKNKQVTTFVFAWYNIETRQCWLMGWIHKPEFMRLAKKDEKFSPNSKWPESNRSLKYFMLHQMDDLERENT